MKKYLLLVLVFSFVLVWCQKNTLATLDVSAITDLPTLEGVIAQVSQKMTDWTLSMDQAKNIVQQLQQKYLDITDTTDQVIENNFDAIQKTFDEKSVVIYWLPLWAKKLWMVEPQWMSLDTPSSLYTPTTASGYSSITLVYTWDYTLALQQAQHIAQQAHLYVTKNFQQAQALAKLGNIDYISGLDIGDISKWIVYTNHELLDVNVDNLLSVSVDQNWVLIIETTKYKND